MTVSRFLTLLPLLAAACAAPASTSSEKLHGLFDKEWQARLRESPLLATSVGVHDFDDRLPSRRLEDLEGLKAADQAFLDELHAIPRETLSKSDRISYSMFERQLNNRISDRDFGGDFLTINADSGFHSSMARLADEVPLQTTRDYENYIARLREIPRYFSEQILLMREGLRRGVTPARVSVAGVEETMKSHVVDAAESSVFYAPFREFPVGVPESERGRLREAGVGAILDDVIPAYRDVAEFTEKEYVPGCRESLGASELPDGEAYYAYLIRKHTTLDLTAGQVHEIGLREVERIRGEMEAIIREVDFKGAFAEFLTFLRTDPRFYAKTPEELLRRAAWIAKQIDGKLPSLFKTLPRLPYTVEPVPDSIAPKYTGGRYVSAPVGSTRPGIYWVNTYMLESRPFYTQPSLTLHEAVPGHHLQNALLQELDGLPEFRRYSGINAFGEGWGLYSEFLGIEAGIYKDAYENFGRLTYEMWRACRLVVDTGIHSMGWTRQQSIDYLAANTALSLHECTTETDRYISWPGQALAYKMGELKIKELRKKAEQALGSNFNIREFHDAILLNGPVPLDVLEEQIDEFIERSRGGSAN